VSGLWPTASQRRAQAIATQKKLVFSEITAHSEKTATYIMNDDD
jgi:hypothetical protein